MYDFALWNEFGTNKDPQMAAPKTMKQAMELNIILLIYPGLFTDPQQHVVHMLQGLILWLDINLIHTYRIHVLLQQTYGVKQGTNTDKIIRVRIIIKTSPAKCFKYSFTLYDPST